MPEKNPTPKEELAILRHSTAHALAAATLKIFPELKYAVGPATEQGFYYDFELSRPLTPEDLPQIEKELRKIINADLPFEKKEVSLKEAREIFKKVDQPYKLELLDDIEVKENPKKVTLYQLGDFVDLCRGPHLKSTGQITADAVKLTKISGAYWKADESKAMLQRLYGVVFPTKEELKKHLELVKEAEKRDHRKLGKELDLFCFSDLVGPGLPLFTPKGTVIKEELQKHIETICRKEGFEKVATPHLAKIDLYALSGHKDKFGDELFHVQSHFKQDYVLKPVQCPHQTQIYASRPRSYRDLPIRYMESEKQYRDEKPGEISGLSRVIAITVEDGHSFCRLDQVKDEVKKLVNIIQNFYQGLGLWDNHQVVLSVRDYEHPEKYIGEPKDWDLCESMLQEVSDEMGLNAEKREGEAALYGPKLDFMFKDALGKEIQIPTVQVDFATPKRFKLTYTNEKGEAVPPVMVHRAVLGSYERFLVLLIEHFAGAFPLWLSPVQALVLPVSEKFLAYAQEVAASLKEAGIRAQVDASDDSLGKKIRSGEKQKTPYMLIVGEKEVKDKTVSPRSRQKGNEDPVSLSKFQERLLEEIAQKKS